MNFFGILCFLLQAAVVPPSAVVVKAPDRNVTISVLSASGASVVSAKRLADAVGGSVTPTQPGRYIVSVGAAQFEFTEGAPYVRIDSSVIPLADAPAQVGEDFFIPLQAVAELIPYYTAGVEYKRSNDELIVTSAAIAARPASLMKPAGSLKPFLPPVAAVIKSPPPAKPDATSVRKVTPKKRLIVIDPGHGGVDPGMRGPIGAGPRIQEKHIVLAVSRLIEKHVKALGHDVLMTRAKDTLIALADRGRIANKAGGDVFVSVHVNAAGGKGAAAAKARGFETYFLAEAKTAEAARVEQMENEAVKFETQVEAPKGDPLSFIINDMAQNEHLRESSELAQFVQDELAKVHPGPNRSVQQANFAVLRGAFMPAVLVELGFGTNPQEAKFLSDPKEQDKLAQQIAKAIIHYLERYDARLKGVAP